MKGESGSTRWFPVTPRVVIWHVCHILHEQVSWGKWCVSLKSKITYRVGQRGKKRRGIKLLTFSPHHNTQRGCMGGSHKQCWSTCSYLLARLTIESHKLATFLNALAASVAHILYSDDNEKKTLEIYSRSWPECIWYLIRLTESHQITKFPGKGPLLEAQQVQIIFRW
jgi:hypothetical protein